MKTIVLALITVATLSGCSASLIERLSTDKFWGPEGRPTVSEHPIGADDNFGVAKRLLVHNPLPYPITAKVVCSSMFQDDPVVHVRPRSIRYVLITAPRSKEHTESCFLSSYQAEAL